MSVNYVEVKVEEGILRGQQKTTDGISRTKYYAFQGIPYAKPPVGELRFKDPQPLDPWDGIKDAMKDGNLTCQQYFNTGPIYGDEDCLYLNVFTPEILNGNQCLKPVLFNIHGGGFIGGSGGTDMCTPDYYVEHDVVFVSPNYRCGALGFLSLQNDEISGNAGLKDQTQALLWTHRNIKQFGGDPDNITIMGVSAGGASVEYLLLTDLTKGLFKQAIIQSGSTFNTWSFNYNPKQFAIRLAQLLGYTGNTKDDKSLENFFKSCSAKDIVEKQSDVLNDQETILNIRFTFAPCVEKEGNGKKFITSTPRDLLKNGKYHKVPIITGVTNSEGCLFYLFSKVLEDDFALINSKPELLIPMNLNVPEIKKAEVTKEIMQFYFDNKPVSRENTDEFTYLIGDITFYIGINESTKYYLQTSPKPLYSYGLSYEASVSFIKTLTKATQPDVELKGVPHGGDLDLMFKINNPLAPLHQPSETDKKYITIVTTMITSFAKTGNPNYEGMEFPTWEPANKSKSQYLDIGNELKMIPGWLYEDRLQFWSNLYEKYGYLY